MEQEFDLWGDPSGLPCGRRGRPKHIATSKNRNKVMMLQAIGWSNQRIANAIRCSLPTLRRYYFSELKERDIQRDRLDAWRFEKVIAQADTGNVGALRLLNQMIDKSDMMRIQQTLRDPDDEPAEKVGKKEQRRRDAEDLIKDGNIDDWGGDLTPGGYH